MALQSVHPIRDVEFSNFCIDEHNTIIKYNKDTIDTAGKIQSKNIIKFVSRYN